MIISRFKITKKLVNIQLFQISLVVKLTEIGQLEYYCSACWASCSLSHPLLNATWVILMTTL